MWVVNATPRPLYPRERDWVGPGVQSGRVLTISPPTGIRSPDRPACKESLYRLSYPGPHINLYRREKFTLTILIIQTEKINRATFGVLAKGLTFLAKLRLHNKLGQKQVEGSADTAPLSLNLGNRLRRARSFEPQQLYPCVKAC